MVCCLAANQLIMFRFLIGAILLLTLAVHASAQQAADAPRFSFTTKRYHDFGGIYQNGYVSYQFDFTNSGKTPLFISEVHASSRAMNTPPYKIIVTWTKGPIPPGQGGKIEVAFKASADTGLFKNIILINSNATTNNYPLLLVTGKIRNEQPYLPVAPQIPPEFLAQDIP